MATKMATGQSGQDDTREGQDAGKCRQNLTRGAVYLAVTVLVLFVLAYLLPEVLGIDLGAFMRGDTVIGTLRLALGLAIAASVVLSLVRLVRSFTLEGEGWRQGLHNVLASHMLGRDFLAIVLGVAAGAALIVWGIVGLVG